VRLLFRNQIVKYLQSSVLANVSVSKQLSSVFTEDILYVYRYNLKAEVCVVDVPHLVILHR